MTTDASRARWWAVAIVMSASAITFARAFAQAVPPPIELHDKGAHFDHADHAKRGQKLQPCTQCHAIGADGLAMPPAALGHSPCLTSNCHANYFLTNLATSKDAGLVTRATAFCLGCHDTPDGKAPAPTSKPTWNTAMRSFQAERDWHVEMPHYDHVAKNHERTDCKSCHVTAATDSPLHLALVPGTPGHQQCGICHTKDDPTLHMDQCEHCHKDGARAAYLGPSRSSTDVRACDSEGYVTYLAQREKKRATTKVTPCFKHETESHRLVYKAGVIATGKDGKPAEVECATCHYIVSDKSRWAGLSYETLPDLHKNPIIDNRQNEEHAACSTGGACHTADFGAHKCELCHAGRDAF